MVMPVATPMANVAVKIFTHILDSASSSGSFERNALVTKMAMIRPMPMEIGTKMKW